MTEPSTVLALQGSPRAGGNSDTLLDALLEPAEGSGLSVERVRVSTLGIRPCRGCHWCESNGACIQEDPMANMFPRLLSARWVVLSAPIFFYNVPGQTKIFIDRTQPLWARKYLLGEGKGPSPISPPGRRGFVVAAGATRGKNLFKGLAWTARYFFDAIDVENGGMIGVRSLEDKHDARGNADALAEAKEAGETLFRDAAGP